MVFNKVLTPPSVTPSVRSTVYRSTVYEVGLLTDPRTMHYTTAFCFFLAGFRLKVLPKGLSV